MLSYLDIISHIVLSENNHEILCQAICCLTYDRIRERTEGKEFVV